MNYDFIERMKKVMPDKVFRRWRFGQLHQEDVKKYIEKNNKMENKND